MRRLLLGIALVCLWPALAWSQTASISQVVSQCGTLSPSYTPGSQRPETVDVNGNKCVANTGSGGTVTANPNVGTPAQTSVTVGNSSTSLANSFTKFGKVCVAFGSAAGAWVDWSGAAAVTASPSEHLSVGQCAYWTSFVPTSTWHAISDTGATNSTITVEGN